MGLVVRVQRNLWNVKDGVTISMGANFHDVTVDSDAKVAVVQGGHQNLHSLNVSLSCHFIILLFVGMLAHKLCLMSFCSDAGGATYAAISDATAPHGLALPWGTAYQPGERKSA